MNSLPIKLTTEQERALELMLSGKNVFLTGEAGTGKSTILRKTHSGDEKIAVSFRSLLGGMCCCKILQFSHKRRGCKNVQP